MEKACQVMYFLTMRRRRKRRKQLAKNRAVRRRKDFLIKQASESLLFFTFLVASLSVSMSLPSPRSLWMKERSDRWWEHVVKSTFTPQDWIDNFRMSQATFNYICMKLRPFVSKTNTTMRDAIATEKRVAITLWFLATGSDYRTIGHLFGVAKSTVCIITKEVCDYLVSQLLPQYIRLPQANALREVMNGFASDHGFPQCAGAVDGTHIPISSPQDCPAYYYNRKGWHSILMQGTVNH